MSASAGYTAMMLRRACMSGSGLTIGCLSASEIFLLYDKHIRPPNTHMVE